MGSRNVLPTPVKINIDGVLSALADDLGWANGMDGGHVHGREAVRDYWTRQWALQAHNHGLRDKTVAHVFRVRAGKVVRFDIEDVS